MPRSTIDYATICRIAREALPRGDYRPHSLVDRALMDAAVQWTEEQHFPLVAVDPGPVVEHPEIQTVEFDKTISRAAHYARVRELLEANNALVERARAAEKKSADSENALLSYREAFTGLHDERRRLAREHAAAEEKVNELASKVGELLDALSEARRQIGEEPIHGHAMPYRVSLTLANGQRILTLTNAAGTEALRGMPTAAVEVVDFPVPRNEPDGIRFFDAKTGLPIR